jgi:hypothetical protein
MLELCARGGTRRSITRYAIIVPCNFRQSHTYTSSCTSQHASQNRCPALRFPQSSHHPQPRSRFIRSASPPHTPPATAPAATTGHATSSARVGGQSFSQRPRTRQEKRGNAREMSPQRTVLAEPYGYREKRGDVRERMAMPPRNHGFKSHHPHFSTNCFKAANADGFSLCSA